MNTLKNVYIFLKCRNWLKRDCKRTGEGNFIQFRFRQTLFNGNKILFFNKKVFLDL